MKPGPYFLGGIDWALDVPLDTLPEDALTFIPGLRTDQAQSRVVGDIGAVAVACKRLGVAPPSRNAAPKDVKGARVLREYQKYGVGWLSQALMRESGALLADDMGCIDGQAEVIVYRNAATRRMSLKQLHDKFHRLGGEWRCRALVDGIFRQHRIVDVLAKGYRPCVEVRLKDGKTLTCTPDHELLTMEGWKPAEKLGPKDVVLTNGYNVGKSNSNWRGGRVIDSDGYVRVWAPDHPKAVQGKVCEHRLVMERVLGRYLADDEVVHHKDQNKQNNDPANLELMSRSAHALEHGTEKWRHLDGGRTRNGGEVIIVPRPVEVLEVVRTAAVEVYDIKMEAPHHNFVANRMVVHNCGKTLQTLALADVLHARILVVSPASARETWLEEAVKWGWREDEVALVLPVNDRRCASEAEKVATARMVVTSYELLKRAGSGYPLIAFEEMHALKGRKNKLLNTIREFTTMAQFKLGITATPDYDRPRDWYALLRLLLGKRFGDSLGFDAAYCGGHFDEANHWQNTGATRIDELRLRLGYYLLRREKREVLKELPPKSRQVIWLPADARATDARRSMSRTADGFHRALLAALDAKKEVCVQMAAQAKRFLMFTWLKEDARQLQARCIAEGAKCVRIDGNMTHHQRQAAIKTAQNERIGIVATLDSAGQSLNLQGVASYGIMHALSPSPNKMLQAEDRIYRFGTTEAVQWMYPAVRDSADELVIRHNVNKLDMMRGNKPGTSEQTAMRDDLNAGPAGVPTEDEVLAAAYAEME